MLRHLLCLIGFYLVFISSALATCFLKNADIKSGLYMVSELCPNKEYCPSSDFKNLKLKPNKSYKFSYLPEDGGGTGLVKITKNFFIPVSKKEKDTRDWQDSYVYVRRGGVNFLCLGSSSRVFPKLASSKGYKQISVEDYENYNRFSEVFIKKRKVRDFLSGKFHIRYLPTRSGNSVHQCVRSDNEFRRFVFSNSSRFWPDILRIRRAIQVGASLFPDFASNAYAKKPRANLMDMRTEVDLLQYNKIDDNTSCVNFSTKATGVKLKLRIDDLEVAARSVKSISDEFIKNSDRLGEYSRRHVTKVTIKIE